MEPPEQPAILDPETRARLREHHLVPIHFMVSSNVPPDVAQAALAGVTDALVASGQERQLVPVEGQPGYLSADWYIEGALGRQRELRESGFGAQVEIEELLRQVALAEPQQQPHWGVLVTNSDLTAEGLNFVFGATNREAFSTVQSVRRFVETVTDPRLRNAMISRLFRHETGHLLGLPTDQRPNTEENLGAHCTNVCTMRQGVSIQAWARNTVEEFKSGVHFCEDCRQDLAEARARYLPLPPA